MNKLRCGVTPLVLAHEPPVPPPHRATALLHESWVGGVPIAKCPRTNLRCHFDPRTIENHMRRNPELWNWVAVRPQMHFVDAGEICGKGGRGAGGVGKADCGGERAEKGQVPSRPRSLLGAS